jgi:hypothetical protein
VRGRSVNSFFETSKKLPRGRRLSLFLGGVLGLEEPNGEILPMDVWAAYMARATEGESPLGLPEGDSGDFRILYGGYHDPVF